MTTCRSTTLIHSTAKPQRHGMLASVGLVTAHRIFMANFWVSKQHGFFIVDNERYQPPWNRKNFQHLYIKYTSVLLRLVSGVPGTTYNSYRLLDPNHPSHAPPNSLRASPPSLSLHNRRVSEASQLAGIPNRIVWCHRKNTPTTAPVEDNIHHSTSTCF